MRQYPSKLLLFGEYILLKGASALATPLAFYSGKWAEGRNRKSPDPELTAFAQSAEIAAIEGLDFLQFRRDVAEGLYFDSNIPQGYGLGSSGALCAAVYDKYAQSKTLDLSELKTIFSAMESFFHGKSSGIDPLTSLLNQPLWIDNIDEVRIFEAPTWGKDQPVVFLLDTHLQRQTAPLVSWFMNSWDNSDFALRVQEQLLPAHNATLSAWKSRTGIAFWENIKKVAAFQLENMQLMIPENLHTIWEFCLNRDDLVLKLCGAGGGGFMLGFAKDKITAMEILNQFSLIFPFEKYGLVEI